MDGFLAYVATGAAVGFVSGMLGIGGGMVMVPALAALFAGQSLWPAHGLHLALGTSMATVLFTGASSVRTHHRLGGVDWSIVKRLGPGMALGALVASGISGWLPQRALALTFALIVYGAAAQILMSRQPESAARGLPGSLGLWLVGLFIGVIAGLVSAGGACLSMPFLLWCGVPIRTAIGTGAALGLPVAALGIAGYVGSGWSVGGAPWGALGFVYAPALAAIVVASMPMAQWGARVAHRLPVQTLRRLFALLLFGVATRMAWSYW